MENNITTENDENADVQSVGELLRNARVKQGKTISDVADVLCIRKFYLNAIENMDLANIPAAPYGTGFIRSYAEYLGLNSERIVSSYRQNLSPDNMDDDNRRTNTSSGTPKFYHIFLGICGFVAIIFAWTMWPQIAPLEDFSQENLAAPAPTAEIVIEVDENNDVADDTALETENTAEDAEVISDETNQEETEPEPVLSEQLKIELTGPSWIELKNGNKVLLNGIYNKGYVYDNTLDKGTTISVGRPKNVQIYINGTPTKVVSSLKKANISLDQFMRKK